MLTLEVGYYLVLRGWRTLGGEGASGWILLSSTPYGVNDGKARGIWLSRGGNGTTNTPYSVVVDVKGLACGSNVGDYCESISHSTISKMKSQE